jgi:AcrR family transcriptional regulator
MDKLKKDILKTSSELFCKYGLKSVSIDDICSDLGISKKTFYNYFKQKSALVLDVLHSLHEQKDDITQETKKLEEDPSKNAIDRIMSIMQFFKSSKGKTHQSFFYDLTKYYPKIHEEF